VYRLPEIARFLEAEKQWNHFEFVQRAGEPAVEGRTQPSSFSIIIIFIY